MGQLFIPIETGLVSDGYHTFDELYEHRCLLFAALTQTRPHLSWKSKLHHDGSEYSGWFIAGMILSGQKQITYHLPNKYWEICKGSEFEKAPKWDGHTSQDVIVRLKNWLGLNSV